MSCGVRVKSKRTSVVVNEALAAFVALLDVRTAKRSISLSLLECGANKCAW